MATANAQVAVLLNVLGAIHFCAFPVFMTTIIPIHVKGRYNAEDVK
jgi:hypothetical protein